VGLSCWVKNVVRFKRREKRGGEADEPVPASGKRRVRMGGWSTTTHTLREARTKVYIGEEQK